VPSPEPVTSRRGFFWVGRPGWSTLLVQRGYVHGNGHAMMLETNNVEALEPIARWIEAKAGM
jgi:hypothetical protein